MSQKQKWVLVVGVGFISAVVYAETATGQESIEDIETIVGYLWSVTGGRWF